MSSDKVRGGLFVVSAPSGAGKTSLTRAVLEPLSKSGVPATISVSYTTRRPRPGEQEGVHYHFVERAAFDRMVKRGEFLEHAEVFGNGYGTARANTEALLARGRDVILDIDWQGYRQLKAAVPDVTGIFILPPSMAKLEQRLRARRQDGEDAIAQRMAQAREELAHYVEYDYVVVNKDFSQALSELVAIFAARRLRREAQEVRHKSLIQKLLA